MKAIFNHFYSYLRYVEMLQRQMILCHMLVQFVPKMIAPINKLFTVAEDRIS